MNNRDAILTAVKPFLNESLSVFEIGSGTGQHAAYLAEHLPHLSWQPSDLVDNHEGINEWIDESELNNIFKPVELDVNQALDHSKQYDVIFMANTLHIMDMPTVENCLNKSKELLSDNGLLIIYGPFKYQGKFTSESNERFEQWLKASDVSKGIRDFEQINALLEKQGFNLVEDISMPANNQLIVWNICPS